MSRSKRTKPPHGYVRRTLTIVALVPKYPAHDEVAAFVADSLSWAGGCKRDTDPFFNSLSVEEVTCAGHKYKFDGQEMDPLYLKDLESDDWP